MTENTTNEPQPAVTMSPDELAIALFTTGQQMTGGRAEAERLLKQIKDRAADRAAVLREAAEAIDATRAPFPIAVQNGITWATAELRRAAAAEPAAAGPDQTPTPCGPAPSQCDAEAGEPCSNHERQQAHAEGEHCFCGPECAADEVVHGCPPDGSGLTPCCGRTPFELPLADRISSEVPVTCPGPAVGGAAADRGPAVSARPLLCTRCGSPAGVAEDVTAHCDWGLAVVDEAGIVRPAKQHMDFYKGEPVRVRGVCSSPDCQHQWTLRRRFETEARP